MTSDVNQPLQLHWLTGRAVTERSLSDSTERCISVPQDMLPMPGDPTQGSTNYNIEDFADLGMFPPFSE